MEHFDSPFVSSDLTSACALENMRFLDGVVERAREHRYFAHPFLTAFDAGAPSRAYARTVLTSVYHLVRPFTAFLCALGGQAPTLRTRFALMDNIYEEMGRGDIASAHPSLYLKMLASIGVDEEEAETTPPLPEIASINDHLREVVERRPFSVACAMLALAEMVIPPTFPVFVQLARTAYPNVDMEFFDRHGPRDEGHSDDAAVLFAVTADPSHYAVVEAEAHRALELRTHLFDEWMRIAARMRASWRPVVGPRPPRAHSERPPRMASERPPRSAPLSVRPPPAVPTRIPPSA